MDSNDELPPKAMDSLNLQDYVSGTMNRQDLSLTPEVFAGALRADIAAHVRAGWHWVEGRLKKGNLEARPTPRLRSKSGQPDFNPRVDALPIREGGYFVSPGRYMHPVLGLVDVNAMPVPDDECPECGGMPWNVHIPVFDSHGEPVIPLRYQSTYCRRCVSPEEIADAKRRREAYKPVRGKP